MNLSDHEIWELLRPFIRSEIQPGKTQLAQKKKLVRSFVRRVLAPMNRTPQLVTHIYTEKWTDRSFDVLTPNGKSARRIAWNSRHLLANPLCVKRIHIAQLIRIISNLHPRSVLEVGCGQGIVLSILSRLFPNIKFAGLELTPMGAQWAQRLGSEALPVPIKAFSPLEVPENPPSMTPQIICASAATIPFRQNAFDMVYSVQALEQMESIRPLVLTEISRVAGHYACMFEPFADWNRSLQKTSYIKANGIWRGALSDLHRFGLIPIMQRSDLPHKSNMRIGCVVCKVQPN